MYLIIRMVNVYIIINMMITYLLRNYILFVENIERKKNLII